MSEKTSHPSGEDLTRQAKGVNWVDLMEEDARPVPDFLKEPSYEYLGSDPIPASRYTSVEFEKLEKEKMWPNIWQFAAREEDLLEPGDYVVFDNADRTFLIVRQDDGGVKAFHNVCLHRGRKLRTEDGCACLLYTSPSPRD